jgi:hypothetical protein
MSDQSLSEVNPRIKAVEGGAEVSGKIPRSVITQ